MPEQPRFRNEPSLRPVLFFKKLKKALRGAMYGHIWPYMAIYGPYMTIYGHIWAIYGHIWVIYGHIWPIYGPYMAIYGPSLKKCSPICILVFVVFAFKISFLRPGHGHRRKLCLEIPYPGMRMPSLYDSGVRLHLHFCAQLLRFILVCPTGLIWSLLV